MQKCYPLFSPETHRTLSRHYSVWFGLLQYREMDSLQVKIRSSAGSHSFLNIRVVNITFVSNSCFLLLSIRHLSLRRLQGNGWFRRRKPVDLCWDGETTEAPMLRSLGVNRLLRHMRQSPWQNETCRLVLYIMHTCNNYCNPCDLKFV